MTRTKIPRLLSVFSVHPDVTRHYELSRLVETLLLVLYDVSHSVSFVQLPFFCMLLRVHLHVSSLGNRARDELVTWVEIVPAQVTLVLAPNGYKVWSVCIRLPFKWLLFYMLMYECFNGCSTSVVIAEQCRCCQQPNIIYSRPRPTFYDDQNCLFWVHRFISEPALSLSLSLNRTSQVHHAGKEVSEASLACMPVHNTTTKTVAHLNLILPLYLLYGTVTAFCADFVYVC